MKLTNGEIHVAWNALREISAEKWPIKTAIDLKVLIKELQARYSIIEETRVELVRKCSNGKERIADSDAGWIEFTKEYKELMSLECELNFTAVTIHSTNGLTVKPEILFALDKFVSFEVS